MLKRLRGVGRRHRAVSLTFVSLSLVVTAAAGVVQEHIDDHGSDALLPRSKEALETTEIVAMLQLPSVLNGQPVYVGSIRVGDNIEWQGVKVFLCAECTGGWRREAFAVGPDERMGPRKISLWHVTYRFGNEMVRAPTVAQLMSADVNTWCYIVNPPCKNDPDGTKFGAAPVPSRWHPTRPINLCRELIRYELMRQVDAGMRRESPLVMGPGGKIWTKSAPM